MNLYRSSNKGRQGKTIVFGIMIVLVIVMLVFGVVQANGNKQIFDFNNDFEYAYVCWPDGTPEKLRLKKWNDYDGDQIQLITTDGGCYVFHSSKCVLANK